jgi:hypothetical protein
VDIVPRRSRGWIDRERGRQEWIDMSDMRMNKQRIRRGRIDREERGKNRQRGIQILIDKGREGADRGKEQSWQFYFK